MASQCNQSFAATAIISHDLAEKRAIDHLATDVGLATTTTTPPKTMSLAADQVQAAVAAKKPIGKPSGDGVRILTLAEYKEAALSLAEAFKDDHTSQYFTHTPDRAHWTEQQRWELHVKVMEYITYAHLLKGLVVSAGPNYDCVALWYVYNTSAFFRSCVHMFLLSFPFLPFYYPTYSLTLPLSLSTPTSNSHPPSPQDAPRKRHRRLLHPLPLGPLASTLPTLARRAHKIFPRIPPLTNDDQTPNSRPTSRRRLVVSRIHRNSRRESRKRVCAPSD